MSKLQIVDISEPEKLPPELVDVLIHRQELPGSIMARLRDELALVFAFPESDDFLEACIRENALAIRITGNEPQLFHAHALRESHFALMNPDADSKGRHSLTGVCRSHDALECYRAELSAGLGVALQQRAQLHLHHYQSPWSFGRWNLRSMLKPKKTVSVGALLEALVDLGDNDATVQEHIQALRRSIIHRCIFVPWGSGARVVLFLDGTTVHDRVDPHELSSLPKCQEVDPRSTLEFIRGPQPSYSNLWRRMKRCVKLY